MEKKDKRNGDTADLRKRAEEKIRADDAKTKKKLTAEETRKMLHELRVHQIELEMQNEELRRAQAELDAERTRYFDLYDLAPVGYCTLSEEGLILEANLTVAKLFGWERKQLVKQPLTSFILNEDQDVYYRLRKQLFESGAPQACELRMVKIDRTPPVGRRIEAPEGVRCIGVPAGVDFQGSVFWARLEATVAQDADGALVGRVVLSDISERKQVKAALRESEARYWTFFDTSRDCVFITSVTGRCLYMNDAALELFGYTSREELSQVNIPDLYANPEERAKHISIIIERGYSKEFPVDLRRKDGVVIHALITAVSRYDADGNVIGFQGTIRDITERKRAERDLQILSSRNQAMLEAIPDIIMEVDTKKVYTWANHAGIEFFGDGVIGKEASYYFEGEQQAYQAVIPIFNGYEDIVYVESWQRRRDGEKRLLAWWYRILKDEFGHVTGALSSARDITEIKRVEEALRQSEVQLQVILESTADGILAINNKGKVIKINKRFAELWRIPQDLLDTADDNALLNYVLDQLVNPEEFLAKVRLLYQSTAEDLDMLAFKNGRIFERFSAPLFLSDSSIGRVWSFRDVTERRRTEETIRASLAEKEILLKEVHHRVKNNLMTIIGLINMQETKANNKMFNPLLQELEGRIRSMALVHESLHKAEDLAHVNLQNYIETMSAHIRAQFGAERDIRFRVQAAGVDVNLDIAVPCGLILNELITNAYKHAFPKDKPRAGEGNCEINVIVNQEGGMNLLTVADNGVGLPADLDWEKSEALGLRLIKMLSKQLNGSIELDSSAGTVFRLKFPVAV